jgi:rhodanese-related sulfurtransferase
VYGYYQNDAVNQLIKNGLAEHYEMNTDCEVELVQEITIEELNEKIKNGDDFQLIDVREWHEHEAFNIGGEWIQMNDLLKQPEKIATNKPVILYCRIGERSRITQQRLQDKYGFSNLFNLKGGIKKLMN